MSPALAIGLALLLAHELDAMTAKEWRLIPLLCRLEDDRARPLFLLAHVPIVALVLWGLAGGSAPTWAQATDVFLAVHVGLHLLLRNHPENRFGSGPLSWLLIGGAGIAGTLDLIA